MEKMKPGKGSNSDRRISLMRKAKTHAENRLGISGREKVRRRAPITLPRLSCLEEKEEDAGQDHE